MERNPVHNILLQAFLTDPDSPSGTKQSRIDKNQQIAALFAPGLFSHKAGLFMQPVQKVTSHPTEADTCRQYVVPKLQAAGWDSEPHSIAEQRSFTNGRIVVAGTKPRRLERKKSDYLLRYTPDFMIAVVE